LARFQILSIVLLVGAVGVGAILWATRRHKDKPNANAGFWGLMRHINEWFGRWPRFWASVFIVWLVINHGFLAVSGEHSLKVLIEHGSWMPWHLFDLHAALVIIVASFTFLFFSWQLWGLRERLLRVTAKVSKSDGDHAHGVLVIPLSWRNADDPSALTKTFSKWDGHLANATESLNAKSLDWLDPLRQICEADSLFKGWNWQQPLRIILHDLEKATGRGPVRKIVVLASPESADLVPLFATMIQGYLAACPLGPVELDIDDPLVDMKTIDGSYEKISKIIESNLKGRKRRICIDVTGGTVIFSIAAALATTNRKMAFSYVDGTEPRFYDANVSGIEFGME
jgi:hypothetical protein